LATFDGPARAVRCARSTVEAVRPLGLEIRAGCHTGEVELDGDEVRGIAVHIGSRVGSLAGPSEVLVSSTVKDLVAGSGLVFEDAGEHELKASPIGGDCIGHDRMSVVSAECDVEPVPRV
jgi:class 3 adenylate cyclase